MRNPVIIALTVTLCGCSVDGSSTRERIAGEPTCNDCSIELEPILTLGSDHPAGGGRFPATVAKIDDGKYAIAPTYEPGTAAVYRSDGALAAVLGRYGEGPGEMKNVRSVGRWFGDSVAVIHDQNRITVFDAEGTYGRSITLGTSSFLSDDIAPSTQGALLARRTGTAGGADVALREFSSVGEPRHGFGSSTDFGIGRIYAGFVEAGDTIWAADATRYEIDVFARGSDQAIATLRREVEWFPSEATRTHWGGLPGVQDFLRYAPGMFLVLIQRPRADYRLQGSAPSLGAVAAAPRQPDHSAMLERYEQVIELLDFRSGEAVAQLNVTDRWFGGFINEDELYSYEVDPSTGEPAVGVWRVTLSGITIDR